MNDMGMRLKPIKIFYSYYIPGPIPKLLVGTSLLLEDVKLGISNLVLWVSLQSAVF